MKWKRRTVRGVACAGTAAVLASCASTSKGDAIDLLSITPNPQVSFDAAKLAPPLQGCDPLPEAGAGGQSHLQFRGACNFTEDRAVKCSNKGGDDYYAYVVRDLPDSAKLYALINVEHYKGPGTYNQHSVVTLQVNKGGSMYQWKQEAAGLHVTDGGHKVQVDLTTLKPIAGGTASGDVLVKGEVVCQSS